LGVKTLDEFQFTLQPQPIPPIHSPEFKLYFEAVISSSKGIMEAMERMGYGGPSSVRYHMKRLGIKTPVHWYGHPSPRSSEFAPYFENVVRTSKSARDAAARLGYAGPCMIYHHAKRLGIETPSEWVLKPGVRRQRQGLVPEVMMSGMVERAWSGGMVQGEGGILTHYSKRVDLTALEIRVAMTDEHPVFRLCDLFGIKRPPQALPKEPNRKPKWECVVGGLRAYRILREILPFLCGGKLKEAQRALEFFAPDGYRRGHFGGFDIWPRDEFPSRSKGPRRPVITHKP